MSQFLQDFCTYCSCYQIERNYQIWSALGLLSATVGTKVHVMQGDIPIDCKMFICLVGEMATGKSTAKNFAKRLYGLACPEVVTGPSKQSHGDIIKYMASEDAQMQYQDWKKEIITWQPYPFFINELKNFVGYDPAGMIAFLTDIYDGSFSASTLKRGLENITNPSLTILACENPDWLIENLKNKIISGGFGRRMVFCYELVNLTRDKLKPRPVVSREAKAAWERLVAAVKLIKTRSGVFTFSPEGGEYFDSWYYEHNLNLAEGDAVFKGFQKHKDGLLLKVCMLLGVSEPEPDYLITKELLEIGLAILDAIEPNIPKLTIGAGRNELAAPTQRAIDIVQAAGGVMPEKLLRIRIGKDLDPMEQGIVLRWLSEETDQLIRKCVADSNGVQRWCYYTKERLAADIASGAFKVKV